MNAPLPPLYLNRPDIAYGQIRQIESSANLAAHSLEVSFRGNVTRYFTGMAQYLLSRAYNDAGGARTNLQDENIFAVIDPATDEVVGRYPVGQCQGNHGMTLDPEHHRAFLLCQKNHLLTVFDVDANKPIAFLPIPSGADVAKFDPGLSRVYVACSSGFISVFQEDDPDHVRKLEDFPVQKNVHTLAVDIETHRVYAPEQEENGAPVARMIVYEAVPAPKAAPLK